MAPNYANLFMDKLENQMLLEFAQINGVKPLVWYRYIDDVFFIWTDTEESLKESIKSAQTFSQKA